MSAESRPVNPGVNLYDITGYNYNSYRLPLLSVGYDYEDRLSAGIGYSMKTYSFRKEPYSTYQSITSLPELKLNKEVIDW